MSQYRAAKTTYLVGNISADGNIGPIFCPVKSRGPYTVWVDGGGASFTATVQLEVTHKTTSPIAAADWVQEGTTFTVNTRRFIDGDFGALRAVVSGHSAGTVNLYIQGEAGFATS